MAKDIREAELHRALEALHFGFRAITAEPDRILETIGLSRIHHRILYFIGRNPGCSVSELLTIMQVSKQYLNRPMKRLVDEAYILVSVDADDKRVKRLELSAKGQKLESRLTGAQRSLLETVFQECGERGEKAWLKVMERCAGTV